MKPSHVLAVRPAGEWVLGTWWPMPGMGTVLSLTRPFAHRARTPAPTPASPRTPRAAPAAAYTSPSWHCLPSPPCLGTAACASGTGCGFAVWPGAALPPALAGPSMTGQSQVGACWGASGQGPGTLGGGGGRAGGEPHSSEEEVGVHRCCGFWVSGLGLVQGNEVNPHAATCDQSHVRPWQEATCDKRPRDRERGPCSSPALLPPCGPLNKPLSWGALSPHLGPRCYLERHRACRIYSSAQEMSAKC